MNTLKLCAKPLLISVAALTLTACGGKDDDDMKTYQYDVTITNLSYSQPFSPLAAVLHGNDYQPWQLGEAASAGLENLAESGDNSGFLQEATEMSWAQQSSTGVLLPSNQATLQLMAMVNDEDKAQLQLSLATMLVNTNDAFTGINSLDLSSLAEGEQVQHDLYIYDAGTEANSEAVGTIPGPADGGEGYNAARDDVNYVAMHPGVVGRDHMGEAQAVSPSVLSSAHTFDQPIARLTVRRTQ